MRGAAGAGAAETIAGRAGGREAAAARGERLPQLRRPARRRRRRRRERQWRQPPRASILLAWARGERGRALVAPPRQGGGGGVGLFRRPPSAIGPDPPAAQEKEAAAGPGGEAPASRSERGRRGLPDAGRAGPPEGRQGGQTPAAPVPSAPGSGRGEGFRSPARKDRSARGRGLLLWHLRGQPLRRAPTRALPRSFSTPRLSFPDASPGGEAVAGPRPRSLPAFAVAPEAGGRGLRGRAPGGRPAFVSGLCHHPWPKPRACPRPSPRHPAPLRRGLHRPHPTWPGLKSHWDSA